MLCSLFDVQLDNVLTFIQDRPFNDARYAVEWDRIAELGWAPRFHLKDELPAMAQWYLENIDRYENPDDVVRQPQSSLLDQAA